jgi:hypothetical protein
MNLLEAQTAILDGLVEVVQGTWKPKTLYTDQAVLPPTSESDLPEAYINLTTGELDRPEQQRMTGGVCLSLVPEEAVRMDVEICLRELKPQGEPQRLQLHQRAQQLRSAVLMNGSVRRLFAGEPAYWSGETYLSDSFEEDPTADDCLLRVRFYFVVTVALA